MTTTVKKALVSLALIVGFATCGKDDWHGTVHPSLNWASSNAGRLIGQAVNYGAETQFG